METPISDFVQSYAAANMVRFHMPGHKGIPALGSEPLDITEIQGADALYEAGGIISQSESHAAELFGSRRTCYSTEGSSQCIKAMLYLALTCRSAGSLPVVVAARNVHKAFVYGAALLDLDIVWLWPEETSSLCSCTVSLKQLDKTLAELPAPPAAVYLTSPDYLGGMADLRAMAEICHRHGTVLAVDNAHGAYLHFLPQPCHPLDLGADLCCDSAHKTLPVLTGGAYLHIGKQAPVTMAEQAKHALEFFGSTSPSYLTLASLDRCNSMLSEGGRERLKNTAAELEAVRERLRAAGWQLETSDPLRLTLRVPDGLTGTALADRLRQEAIECEYADEEYLVLMATPENTSDDYARLSAALGINERPAALVHPLPLAKSEQVCSIRKALMSPCERIPVEQALGRICGAPTVSCPPAIPIVISGERIGKAAMALFARYGVDTVAVLR